MKITVTALMTVLALVLTCRAGEYVKNGSFETGGNWQKMRGPGRGALNLIEMPADWYVTRVVGNGLRKGKAHHGRNYWYTGGWFTIRQNIHGLVEGESYTISYWGISQRSGHEPRLRFTWNGGWLFDLKGLDHTNKWTFHSRTFKVRSAETSGGLISLNSTLGGGGGASFDSISLIPAAESKAGSRNVELAVVIALGEIGDARAVGQLVAMLKDTSQENGVRIAAARALHKIGAPALKPLIAFVRRDRASTPAEFKVLLKRLAHTDEAVRDQATAGLIAAGSSASYLVEAALKNATDPERVTRLRRITRAAARQSKQESFVARAYAVEALGKIGDTKAAAILVTALKDVHWEVRYRAADALGTLKYKEAVPVLIKAMTDDNDRVREHAAKALASMPDKRAADVLFKALYDDDPEVRYWATQWFRQTKDPRAIDRLAKMLYDSHWHVRLGAGDCLSQYGEDAVPHMVSALRWGDANVFNMAVDALVAVGSPSSESLIKSLTHWDSRVRRGAVEALGRIRDTKAVKPLIKLLKDRNNTVASATIEALGNSRSEDAVIALMDTLQGRHGSVSVHALRRIGKPAIDALVDGLKHQNPRAREKAAETLGQLPDPSTVEPLLAALQDNDKGVRAAAAEALGKLHTRDAVEALIRLITSKTANPSPYDIGAAIDRVHLNSGDIFSGRVSNISTGGVLSFTSPFLENALKIDLAHVRQITPSSVARLERGPDTITLVSGHQISGTVETINAETVTLDTEAMGTLNIPRTVITAVDMQDDHNVLVDSNFTGGGLGRWEIRRGEWDVHGGTLRSRSPSAFIATPVKQEGPITIEWTAEELSKWAGAGVVFFAEDSGAGQFGKNAIYIQPYNTHLTVTRIHRNTTNPVMTKHYYSLYSRAHFRASYEPETGRIKVWIDNRHLGEATIKPAVTVGSAIHLFSPYPTAFGRLRVVRGAAGISKAPKADANAEQFMLASGDKMSGTLKSYDNRTAIVETPYGTIKLAKPLIERILFRNTGTEKVEPPKTDLDLRLHDGTAFTATIKSMNDKVIVVSSSLLGDITITRHAVQYIARIPEKRK